MARITHTIKSSHTIIPPIPTDAKWGKITGDITNQEDLIELIKKTGAEVYKIHELLPTENPQVYNLNEEDRSYIFTNKPTYIEVEGIILSKVQDREGELGYSTLFYDSNMLLDYVTTITDSVGAVSVNTEYVWADQILSKTNTGVGVLASDKVIVGGDVAMGNTAIRSVNADVTAGGKRYNFSNLIVDIQKGAENDVKGVSRNALVVGRSNNVTGVQQALLMGNDNTITTTSTASDGMTINLAPLIGYKNTLTLTKQIPNFQIIGSYNNISGSRGLSNLIGTYNKLNSNSPLSNIYGQNNRDDEGQNNIIGYYNGVSSYGNGIYGNRNSVEGNYNSIYGVYRIRWAFKVTGAANATTYTYTEEGDEFLIKEGLYIIYDGGVGTPSKITSVDTENKTLTVDTTLSTTALNNAIIQVFNIIKGQGNIAVGSGLYVKGSDQALIGGGLSAIDNPSLSTTIGYMNDYGKKGKFSIGDGTLSERHTAMLIDEAGNIEFTPKEGAKLTYNGSEVATVDSLPTPNEIHNEDSTVSVKTTDKVEITGDIKMGNVSIKKVDNTQTNPSTGLVYKFGSFILDTQEGAENVVTGTDYRDALIWGRNNNIKNPQMASVIGVDNTVTSTNNSAVLSQTPIFGNSNKLDFGSNKLHQSVIIGNTNTLTNGSKQVSRFNMFGNNNTIDFTRLTGSYGDNAFIGNYNKITASDVATRLHILGYGNELTASGTAQRVSILGNYNVIDDGVGLSTTLGNYNNIKTTDNGSGVNVLGIHNVVNDNGGLSTVLGSYNESTGRVKHILGHKIKSTHDDQTILGYYNVDADGDFIIADGSSDANRHNAIVINSDVNITPKGKLKYNGEEVATKEYIDEKINELKTLLGL